MIVNRYAKNCQSCGQKVPVGEGFAYKNGYNWYTVCSSTACHRRLGVQAPTPESKQEKKITEDGTIIMPYDRMAVPLIKSLPGARWNPENKHWTVSVDPKDLPRVIEVADQVQLDVPSGLREQAVLGTEESREAIKRTSRLRTDGKELFPYQKKGVEFLALHDRALLADDMGLGKSCQSLVALPENEPVICIVPALVKYNWQNEIQLWRPDYKVHVCNGRESFRFPDRGEIVIINYEILPNWLKPVKDSGITTRAGKAIKVADLSIDQVTALKECVVIADECQKIKSFKAGRSAKFTQLCKNVKRVWALTGTPLMNRPQDLYGILSACDMRAFSWNKFLQLFNGYKNNWGGWEFGLPAEETPEYMKRVMLRRLKSEVLKDLPPKTYKTIEVSIDGKLVKELDELSSEIGDLDGVDLDTLPSFKTFSKIRALLAKSRIPAMLEIVEDYEGSGTPLVVFSAHKAPIEELANRDGWEIITGDTAPKRRTEIVARFQNGELKGVGLTIQAGGVGITLTRASNELFIDLDWTPSANIQAEDRCHRIGATENVLIMQMVSNHVLDRHIQGLIKYKMELMYRALEASINLQPPKKRPLAQEIELVEETDEELMARINAAEIEANREIALGKLQRIAGREAAKVNDVPEPELTAGRKQMLREALAYMVSICDMATSKDGMGFNKPDASIGHWLNATGLREEDDLAFRVLERILVRYRRQLKGRFENIWKPEL